MIVRKEELVESVCGSRIGKGFRSENRKGKELVGWEKEKVSYKRFGRGYSSREQGRFRSRLSVGEVGTLVERAKFGRSKKHKRSPISEKYRNQRSTRAGDSGQPAQQSVDRKEAKIVD